MGTVTVFNAERMKNIEDTTVVSGHIDPLHHLILTTRDGTPIDAGDVHTEAQVVGGNTDSVEVLVTGDGSDAVPFQVKANVKKIPASAVDSGRFDLARIPDQTTTALLPATYRGGDTIVKINGTWTTEQLKWASDYNPSGSRVVRLLKRLDTWVILGQVEDEYHSITFTLNATTYAEQNQSSIFSTHARAIRLSSGIVVLSGLIALVGTVSQGMILGYLPMECAPDKDMIIGLEMGDVSRSIYIRASDGALMFQGQTATNSYLSLDGLAWPAAGVATWTPVGEGGSAWGPNFGPRQVWVDAYGAPSFWKDPYGMVWFRGIVDVKVATSTDDTLMFTLPATHRADIMQHVRGTGWDTFAHYGFAPTVGVQYKLNNPGQVGQWLGLAGLVLITAEGRANNPWVKPRALINGWSNYNPAAYTSASYLLREDGLRVSSGLIGGGSIAKRVISLKDKEYWPDNGRIIIAAAATAGRGRIDICSGRESYGLDYEPGAIILVQGVTTWYSLDGRMWIP